MKNVSPHNQCPSRKKKRSAPKFTYHPAQQTVLIHEYRANLLHIILDTNVCREYKVNTTTLGSYLIVVFRIIIVTKEGRYFHEKKTYRFTKTFLSDPQLQNSR
jgi:hypothetical protein